MKITKKHFNIFIVLPIVVLFLLTASFYILKYFGFSPKNSFDIIFDKQEKLEVAKNEEVLDIKTKFILNSGTKRYFLTKTNLYIVSYNYDDHLYNKKITKINFGKYNITNVSSFGVDNQGFIYIGTKDGLIYKFDPNLKIHKWIKGVNSPDGLSNNGYDCAIINKKSKFFGEIGDIEFYGYENTNSGDKKYCEEELENCVRKYVYIFDKDKNKVFSCNHLFGPGIWDNNKKLFFDIRIKNAKYFFNKENNIVIYNDNGDFQVIRGGLYSWEHDNVKEGQVVHIDKVKGKIFNDPLDYKGKEVYNNIVNKKFGKEIDLLIYTKHLLDKKSYFKDANDYNTIVTYKNTNGVYLLKFKLQNDVNNMYYFNKFLFIIKQFLVFYLIFVHIFLMIYFWQNRINHFVWKYVFVTYSLFILFIGLPEIFVYGGSISDRGIGQLIMFGLFIISFVINNIIIFIYWLVFKKVLNKKDDIKKKIEL